MNDRAPPMKPTPTPDVIERIAKIIDKSAWQAIEDGRDALPHSLWGIRRDGARHTAAEVIASLSVPAAAVVGEPEPIGYCSEYGLDKLASQAHHYCLSVSKAQENEFQFPIYASRISQQDAELDRLRRELAETEKKFETADKLRVFWNDKAMELAEFIRAKAEEANR